MSKSNQKVYLPLSWVKGIKSRPTIYTKPNPDCSRAIVEAQYSTEDVIHRIFFDDYAVALLDRITNSPDRESQDMMENLDAISLILTWAKNKQVYKFDKDFLNELIHTDTVTIDKDGWDYLPYDTFYLDLSDNQEICQKIMGQGIFVKVEKAKSNNRNKSIIPKDCKSSTYCVHLAKVTEDLFFNNIFTFKNETSEIVVSEMNEKNDILVFQDIRDDSNRLIDYVTSKATIDGNLYKQLIAQILTYLSSLEPDIAENENTQRTYRRPAQGSEPKDKFSEIQQWDVGVRFGSSFRKWKKQQRETEPDDAITKSSGAHTRKRPHSRRAHWSHYWYGSGTEKVRRPKWLSSCFVNANYADETDVVIHKV